MPTDFQSAVMIHPANPKFTVTVATSFIASTNQIFAHFTTAIDMTRGASHSRLWTPKSLTCSNCRGLS